MDKPHEQVIYLSASNQAAEFRWNSKADVTQAETQRALPRKVLPTPTPGQ